MSTRQMSVEEILNLPKDKQISKRIEYINNHVLDEIPGRIRPDTYTEDYFFISYSHKDYKLVYKDIFLLQKEGLSIWYDKDMVAGDSWKDTANKYMLPRTCLGVIFYVSEESLKSEAVLDELAFAYKTGKTFLCISLPFVSDLKHNNKPVKDEIYLPYEMIEILLENHIIDEDKAKELHKYFPKTVIYLKYDYDIFDKTKKIKDTLKKQPLLKYNDEGTIVSIYDTNITKVVPKDFLIDDSKRLPFGFITIGECAFANCAYLESFTLPEAPNRLYVHEEKQIYRLSEYSFFADRMLREFNDGHGLNDVIPAHTFENCYVLETIGDNEIKYVGERAFANCYQLKSITLHPSPFIEKEAFANCKKLENIKLTPLRQMELAREITVYRPQRLKNKAEDDKEHNAARIGEGAFKGCRNLKEFDFPKDAVSIHKETFKDCVSLRKITIYDKVRNIKSSAFLGCNSLQEIIIKGDNPNYVMKDNALYDSKLNTLIKILPNIDGKLNIPIETKIIDKYAMSHFKNKPYIGVDIKNDRFYIYKGGLVDRNNEYLFFLNITKNGMDVLKEIRHIQPFALDNYSDSEEVTIYENMSDINDYTFYSFNNIKTLEVHPNHIKLHQYSFNYKFAPERLIIKAREFNLSDYARFNYIKKVELHNNVTITGDDNTKMLEIGELYVMCSLVFIEVNDILVYKLFIGKDFEDSLDNRRIFTLVHNLSQISIDPDNKYFKIENGKLICK